MKTESSPQSKKLARLFDRQLSTSPRETDTNKRIKPQETLFLRYIIKDNNNNQLLHMTNSID